MAEQWGVPPWTLEGELSCEWHDRWLALQQARGQALEEHTKPRKGGNRKRLI